jgi:hypothetical protein
MKKVRVQNQIIGWEEYTYEVPDNFEDYESLIHNVNYVDWEYLPGSSIDTGEYKIYDEDYNEIEIKKDD